MADKKPSLMIALGIGKKPNSGMSAPPPKFGGGSSAAAEPADGPESEPEPEPDADDEKVAPEKALYHGPEETCGGCEHFTAPSTCAKVDTVVDAGGHCWAFYTPKGGGANMGGGGMPMMPMSGGAPGGESQGA